VITVTRDSSSANMCTITGSTQGTGATWSAGSGSATAVSGRVRFTFTATSTPGNCLEQTTTSSSSIAGSSATLTTQLVGAPNKLAVTSNDSPHPAGANSATTIVVQVNDVNGNRVTSSTNAITATRDDNTCTGAGGGSALPATVTQSAVQGVTTFTITSNGAYSACSYTFTSTGLTSTSTTMAWTPGGADHLTCSFSPLQIVSDGASTSTATVRVRDTLGNTVTTGSYSVTFSRTAGTSTTLLTSNPQQTSGGSTTFTVRSIDNAHQGTDTYRGDVTSGSSPTLPLTAGGANSPAGTGNFAIGANGTCDVGSWSSLPH